MDDRGIVVRYPERQEILLFFNASKPGLGAPTNLLFNEQTAFEMWWHTRKNRISSSGETDESI